MQPTLQRQKPIIKKSMPQLIIIKWNQLSLYGTKYHYLTYTGDGLFTGPKVKSTSKRTANTTKNFTAAY